MSRPLAPTLLLLALAAPPAMSQRIAGPDSRVAPPAPVALDTTGMFLAKFAQVGDDIFIGGQPTERALREMKARGVTTVVNLRSPEEMARIGERARLASDRTAPARRVRVGSAHHGVVQ